MSRFRIACSMASIFVLALIAGSRPAVAADKSAAELLPPTTVAYLQIDRSKDLISFALDGSLRQTIEQSPNYRKAIDSPNYKTFLAIVGLIEQKAGVKWRDALETSTQGGIVIAFDGKTQGLVILVKSGDPKTTDAVRDAFFSLARDDAKNKGNSDPIEEKPYREFTAYKIGDGVIADVGPWMMLTNKTDLAKSIADRFLDGGECLASDRAFGDVARQHAASSPTAWAFVRLDPLRAMAGDTPLFDPKYKSDNPAIEFLVGGLLPVLRKAEYLSAALTVKAGEVKLLLAAPADMPAVARETKFFFAPPGDGAARPLRPEGTMLSVSMYRDVSALWQSGPDLFTEAIATQMAQADSNLSTFFGGKSFGPDVLAAFNPQIQLVAAKQDYTVAGVSAPATRLPGFALVIGVKGEQFAALKKHLRVGFQSAIAFVNIDGTTKGRPTFELQNEKRANADIQFATYDMSEKPTAKDDAYLNFSPALVMAEKYVMFCSTKQIAEQLADLADKQSGDKTTLSDNTLIKIDGAAIASLMKDDREQLISQNMLEKGHDRATAEQEIKIFHALVNYVKEAQVRLTPGEHEVRLEVDVKTAEK